MKSRKQYFGLIMMIYFILFSAFSVTLAQDCPDCTTEEVGTSVHSKKPFPLDGDKNSGSSQLSQKSIQTSSLERADGSSTYFVGNYIFRYVYPTWFNTDINNPIVYTSDEQICFRTYSMPARSGDWFSAKIIFPDGSEIGWQKITWKGNRWYDENGNVLFDNEPGAGGKLLWSEYTAGVQCKPEGEWIINLYHNTYDSPAVTKIVTCKGGAGPDTVKHGENFRQGKYDNEADETHHMDNACRFPKDKVSHFCTNPLAVNEAGETEKKVTIKQIGCALTSCAIMLNYHGIDVTPPVLNSWLKNRTGYAPVANVKWNTVALYGYSNGVYCFYDGLLNNAERIKDYICRYGPQIMGVAGSSKIMNTHWVAVYGWVSDDKGNVTDWLISDPADGRLKSLNDDPRYKGKYGDVHGFRFIRSSARMNAPPSITFNMHSPAELLVIDSQGRRTGYDPATGQNYNEIPEASYIHHVGIEDPETGELYESDLKTLHILNPDPEKYKLVVTGTGNGTYSLDVMGYNQSYTETVKSYEDVPVTPLEVHTYEIQYDGYVDRFEAEAMNLYNYMVEDNPSASGEKLVKVTANPAGASFIYSGDPGVKDLAVWYYDQNNGHSTYQLYINNVLIDSWTADRDLGSAEVDATTRVSRVVSNIQLNTGDQIKIEGLMYGEEYAAIDSVEISKSLETLPRVAPLSFTLASGVYDSPQSVAIICDSGDAVIRYTTNGTTPNQTSPVYSGPIAVTSSMTLKAYASRNGFEDSEVISANYTITNPANRVAAPTFTPVSGNYTFGRKVSIISATAGATIRYTTDGSIPNASSPVYNEPIVVDQTTTIKAYAAKDGISDSGVTTAVYTIKVTEPAFVPASGTYDSTQLVNITCSTRDAVIRYTTDGSIPNASSPIYTDPIKVERSATIKAYASITGFDNSDTVSATYVIKVAAPKFSPTPGTYYSPQNVTVSCADANATIRYTTDGSTPNASSWVYNGSITVDRNTVIKAYASLSGLEDSDVATVNYTLKVHTPIISPGTGVYDPGQTVTISCATGGATIRYTTDGSPPNASSPVYTGPITIEQSTTIKALATKDGWANSDVVTAVYQINTGINAVNLALGCPVQASSLSYYVNTAVPELAVDGDITTFWGSNEGGKLQWIYIDLGSAQNFNNVKLYWMTDYGIEYQIQVSNNAVNWTTIYSRTNGNGGLDDINFLTVNARYVRMNGTDPRGSGFGYKLREFEVYNYTTVPVPAFIPAPGAYAAPQYVTINCAISDATIRYSTDGSLPDASSPVYSHPILVNSDAILRAYAVKDGLNDSSEATASYTIITTPDNLINADFESGPGVGWTEYPIGRRKLIDQTLPHSGLYSARLGGYKCAYDYIEQQINIPIEGKLSFWTIDSSNSSSGFLRVRIYDLNDNLIYILSNPSNIYNDNNWNKETYDLPFYSGQTVKLRFIFETNDIRPVERWIDDISIYSQVRTPTFSQQSGIYKSAQTVTINCGTNEATIYYTTDEKDPTSASLIYTGPIQITKPTTIKAYAVKAGISDSDIAMATYDFKVVTPIIDLESRVYTSPQTVSITCPASDAVIHYTLDGSTPSDASPVYSGPITLTNTAMIKACAIKDEYIDSDIATAVFTITSTPNSLINHDLENGPGVGWTGYTADGHINIDQTRPQTGSYSIRLGDYDNANDYIEQQVVIPPNALLSYWRCVTSEEGLDDAYDFFDVSLYKPDGTLLKTLKISSNMTERDRDNWVPEGINLASYAGQEVILRFTCTTDNGRPSALWIDNVSINSLMSIQAAQPIISPDDGIYITPQIITLLCATNGAAIRYTIDGSNPNSESPVYSGPITITNTTVIKAYAVKDGLIDSSIVTAIYNIPSTPNAIVNFNLESGPGVGWTKYPHRGNEFIDVTRPHTGSYSLHLGGDNGTGYIEQQLIIPPNAALSFWRYLISNDSMFDDYLSVRLYKSDGTFMKTLKNYSNKLKENVWEPDGINLAAYEGQQVLLRFTFKSYSWLASDFWIDNVSINPAPDIPVSVAAPAFSPAGGTYTAAQNVTISCATDRATIRYTIDGSAPDSSSPVYTGPLMISENTTIKAYAYKTGMADSEAATVIYVINIPQVATPAFSPAGGTYTAAQKITISCATADAIIRYTTDGSVPNATSPAYNSPISITTNTTIKAYAYKTGMIDSEVVTATYQIDSSKTVATPTFLPDSETYYWPQIVKIFCPTKGAIIRYTTDGSVPDSTSRIYTHPIMVTKTTTIKAYAVKPGFIESNMATAVYEMKTATPFFSLKPGIYQKPQKVKIHCPTKGAVIRYTTDGSEPNHRSPVYFHPIILKDPTTIKAYAYKHGYSDSEMITATYMIDNRPKTATPIFIPGSGTRMSSQEIRITCKTKGAIIRYTTDGTEPDPSSPVFTGPLKINKTTTVKAYAAKEGHSDSGIATAYYGIMVAPPVFNPKAGKYHSTQKVKISCGTDGATIRYTVDGSIPNALSAIYTEPITISNKTMIKAYASKLGCMNSLIVTANYSVKDKKRSFFSRSGSHYLTQRIINFFRIKWATISFQMTKRFKHLI